MRFAAQPPSPRRALARRAFAIALAASTIAASEATTVESIALAAPKGSKPKKDPPAEVSVAEQLYTKLAYDDANRVAARVLAEKHGLTHDELVRTLRVLAITHAVLNHDDAARDAFQQLLTVSPDEAIDANLGPKVTGPFYEARGYWRGQPSRPGIDAAATLPSASTGSLRVTMRDPTHVVVQVNVGYRWGADGDFTAATISAKSGEPTSMSLPAAPPGQTRLDFYAQALDDHQDVVFESGSPNAPTTANVDVAPVAPLAPVPAQDAKHAGKSFFSSAPFWITVGVVVVGGAVATYFLARPKDQEAPTSASLAPQLNCGIGTACR